MGRIHDWFFNSNHEKCKAEIAQLKLSLAECEASKNVQVERLKQELNTAITTRDTFHSSYNSMKMAYSQSMSENAALVAALSEKEPVKRVTALEHNLMELLCQANSKHLES